MAKYPPDVRLVTWVASATSAISYMCAQHHSSTEAPVYYMNWATLL